MTCTKATGSLDVHLLALEALGTPRLKVLPVVMDCPVCGKHIWVEFDPVRNGLWLMCETCMVAGNVVEFAGHIWQVSLDEAWTRLANRLPAAAARDLDRLRAEAAMFNDMLQLFDAAKTQSLLESDLNLGPALYRAGLNAIGHKDTP